MGSQYIDKAFAAQGTCLVAEGPLGGGGRGVERKWMEDGVIEGKAWNFTRNKLLVTVLTRWLQNIVYVGEDLTRTVVFTSRLSRFSGPPCIRESVADKSQQRRLSQTPLLARKPVSILGTSISRCCNITSVDRVIWVMALITWHQYSKMINDTICSLRNSQPFSSIRARTNKFHESFLPCCLKNFT